MTSQRTGGVRWIRGKAYGRLRLGAGKRLDSIPMPTCKNDDEAATLLARIVEMANGLVRANRWFDVENLAKAMGAAKTEKELRVCELAAQRLVSSGPSIGKGDESFSAFAQQWTDGALHRAYPDHVVKKDARGDVSILTLYVNPLVGHVPLTAFTLEHADSVMASLPSTLGPARRRAVAQVVHRVLAMAAYPAKKIKISPLPKGWLPKLGKGKALAYLYPDEDRTLLASPNVALVDRLLYGFLNREGMRLSEALLLEWTDLDLKRGGVNLDDNKTDDPRAWALDASVTTAMVWWKNNGAPKKGPFRDVSKHHAADRLRADLRKAGVDREALFRKTEKRRPLRAHDLRATFITLALANGKTEAWVQDRTGHGSTLMINKYRRSARTVAELNLGPLTPLAEAITEIVGGDQVGQLEHHMSESATSTLSNGDEVGSPCRTRTGTPFPAEDFKGGAGRASKRKARQTKDARTRSHALAGADPQGDPHPTRAANWRTIADLYDDVVARESGGER